MAVDLEAVKDYCRIDTDDDDVLLASLVDTAVDYLDGAGIPAAMADNPKYIHAIKAQVLELYDHRGMAESVSLSAIPGLENIIVQLKLEAETQRIVEAGL